MLHQSLSYDLLNIIKKSSLLTSRRNFKLFFFFHSTELTTAYNVLRNLTSRREYDKEIGTYFIMRSAKKNKAGEKVLRLTDEMLEIDMKGIRQVLYKYGCFII